MPGFCVTEARESVEDYRVEFPSFSRAIAFVEPSRTRCCRKCQHPIMASSRRFEKISQRVNVDLHGPGPVVTSHEYLWRRWGLFRSNSHLHRVSALHSGGFKPRDTETHTHTQSSATKVSMSSNIQTGRRWWATSAFTPTPLFLIR